MIGQFASQLVSHTPAWVWAILAFLVWRGVVEMRDREIARRQLFVLPLVMLALSMHDIVFKFGAGAAVLAAWLAGCLAAARLARRFGHSRIAPAAMPGRVRVRGSRAPLALMMAIFAFKYAISVILAVQPRSASQLSVLLAVGAVYGVFNGLLLGRLASSQSRPPRSSAAAMTSGARL